MGNLFSRSKYKQEEPGSFWKPKFARQESLSANEARALRQVSTTVGFGNGWPHGRADLILPGLYLADRQAAHDKAKLQALGVTHVVNCARPECGTQPVFYSELNIKYIELNALDSVNYDLFQHYEKVEEFLDSALANNGVCLIHCFAGINRSGGLATAYYMRKKDVSVADAIKHVQKIRKVVLINESFQEGLVRFASKHGHIR